MSNKLSRPKLIFRAVECFSPILSAQFAHEYTLANYCPEKQPCPIFQGGRLELLHQQKFPNNDFAEPQLQRNEKKRSQRFVDQNVMDGNLNAARPVKDYGAIEQQFETSVPITALTAVKVRQKDINEIVFYALADTGADVSICTKDLAEKNVQMEPRR